MLDRDRLEGNPIAFPGRWGSLNNGRYRLLIHFVQSIPSELIYHPTERILWLLTEKNGIIVTTTKKVQWEDFIPPEL
jgi:hypothetical protein